MATGTALANWKRANRAKQLAYEKSHRERTRLRRQAVKAANTTEAD